MQNHAAVFRTGESLKEGVQRIDDCFQGLKDLKVPIYKEHILIIECFDYFYFISYFFFLSLLDF